jgi:hypothetical protein
VLLAALLIAIPLVTWIRTDRRELFFVTCFACALVAVLAHRVLGESWRGQVGLTRDHEQIQVVVLRLRRIPPG